MALDTTLDDDALIVLDDGCHRRIVDPSGRFIFDVTGLPTDTPVDFKKLISADNGRRPSINVNLTIVQEAIDMENCAAAISRLSTAISRFASMEIGICFPDVVDDIPRLISFVSQLRSCAVIRGPIKVTGRFRATSDDMLEMLFNSRIACVYSIGLSCYGFCDDDLVGLSSLTDFGMLVPVAFLVCNENIDQIDKEIERGLAASRSAGFALPLISSSPFFDFAHAEQRLPDAVEYCRLLIRMYEKYPFNDVVFEPVNELAVLLGRGGSWDNNFGLHKCLKVLCDADGSVLVYRNVPRLGLRWSSVDDIAAFSVDECYRSLVTFTKSKFDWHSNHFCGGCRWKKICGGIDNFQYSNLNAKQLNTLCMHRELFIEHFASVVTAPTLGMTTFGD